MIPWGNYLNLEHTWSECYKHSHIGLYLNQGTFEPCRLICPCPDEEQAWLQSGSKQDTFVMVFRFKSRVHLFFWFMHDWILSITALSGFLKNQNFQAVALLEDHEIWKQSFFSSIYIGDVPFSLNHGVVTVQSPLKKCNPNIIINL